LEIEKTPITIELLNSDNMLPIPQAITLSNIGEDNESELVSVSGISFIETGNFAAGYYTVTDGTTDVKFRIGLPTHPLVGTEIPSGSFDLVAYVEQSQSGYQLMTNSSADFTNIVQSALGMDKVKFVLNMVYPNPASDKMMLQIPQVLGAFPVQMKMIDLDGKTIKSANLFEPLVDISDVNVGVYLISIVKGDQAYFSRVIVK
jgi:hypothetical protein